jgi:hypothetical protein
MSRISKDLAMKVAKQMTAKAYEKAEALEKVFASLVKEAYLKTIPQQVVNVFSSFPDYFQTSDSINLDGHGFHRESIEISGEVICNMGDYAKIPLTKEAALPLLKAHREWQKAVDDADKLRNETRVALIQLGTIPKIRESLPQAMPFLPSEANHMALVPNYKSLQKKLEKVLEPQEV